VEAVTITGTTLDHVAHAVPRWQDVWTRYAVDLGAEWNSGGPGPGFAPGQLRFGNDARIEVLMPYDTQVNDFLERFIAKSGPGPHHLTFKVPDLSSALDQARQAGLSPIGIDFSDPEWMEAFIHPKQATGVVVQLAEAPGGWTSPAPDDYPTERRQRSDGRGPVDSAVLRRVVHAVADLDAATALFVELLGGEVSAEATGDQAHWVDVTWPGPMALRLVSPAGPDPSNEIRQWLGNRPGRIHHLELAAEEPERLEGAQPIADSWWLPGPADDGAVRYGWVIAPEDNLGLGLIACEP
jgi:catechol 2,3-dioxygenase-like lactoylglutathione lyase family enzyme